MQKRRCDNPCCDTDNDMGPGHHAAELHASQRPGNTRAFGPARGPADTAGTRPGRPTLDTDDPGGMGADRRAQTPMTEHAPGAGRDDGENEGAAFIDSSDRP